MLYPSATSVCGESRNSAPVPEDQQGPGQHEAGRGEERLVIDLDSFVGEVHGYEKQGAA